MVCMYYFRITITQWERFIKGYCMRNTCTCTSTTKWIENLGSTKVLLPGFTTHFTYEDVVWRLVYITPVQVGMLIKVGLHS